MKIASKYLNSVYVILLTFFILVICYGSALAAQLSDKAAINVIENQRNTSYKNMPVQTGKIGIQTSIASTREGDAIGFLGISGDLYKYTIKYRKKLDTWVKCGVVQVSDEYFISDKKSARNMEILNDGHKYIVSLTEEGKRLGNQRFTDFPTFNVGEIKVTKLVKNIEIKDPAKYGTKEVRLVMGIFDFIPTELGVKYYNALGETLHKQYKFRALLEYDPFKETWKYSAFDFGYLDTGRWATNNVIE